VVFARREGVRVCQMLGRGLRMGGWVWERRGGGVVVERAGACKCADTVIAVVGWALGMQPCCARCARLAGGSCMRIHRGITGGASVCRAVAGVRRRSRDACACGQWRRVLGG